VSHLGRVRELNTIDYWCAWSSGWPAWNRGWAGHRNGSSGLSNPNTADIQNFKIGEDWTNTQVQNGHPCDDVRFWVNLPPIIIE
jgi:hypothetical protein